MTTRFPKPGDLFEDRYRIESVIGTGGFARVYAATQTDLDRPVALKVLFRGFDSDGSPEQEARADSANRRFRREARLVSQLRDPNTITIFDYGESEGGLLYIVLELIDGRSLKEIVTQDGPLEPGRVVNVMQAVLSSLEEAHELGIFHRDIKPANIMLYDHVGREGVKLLDFGIAKLNAKADITNSNEVTRDGALVGTPRYMAPEQIRDQRMIAASDLFSLGLVAYEMLTGEQANPAQTPVTVIGRQLDNRPFLLPWRDDIPLGLRTMIHQLLEKDPDKRFQTATQAAAALHGWDSDLSDATVDGPITGLPRADEPDSVPAQTDHGDFDVPEAPRRAVALLFIAIALLCVATVGLLMTRDAPVEVEPPGDPAARMPAPIVVAVEPDPTAIQATKPPAPVEPAPVEPAPQPARVVPPKPKPPKPRTVVEPAVPPAAEEAPAEEPTTPEPTEEQPSFFSLDDAL